MRHSAIEFISPINLRLEERKFPAPLSLASKQKNETNSESQSNAQDAYIVERARTRTVMIPQGGARLSSASCSGIYGMVAVACEFSRVGTVLYFGVLLVSDLLCASRSPLRPNRPFWSHVCCIVKMSVILNYPRHWFPLRSGAL